MMNNKIYFLKLLKSYIYNKKIEYDENVDWFEILRLANIHSVQCMIYLAIDKLDKRPPIYDELKKLFLKTVQISTLQEIGMKQTIATLNDNCIEHILIKGYVLRNYYPNKEVRSFGDIDILVDESDIKKANNALLNIGFEFNEDKSENAVQTYTKGILCLEMHTDLIYERLFNDFDYINYFREKIKNKEHVKNYTYTYELKKEDHFIYILVHLAKHFYNIGAGIRMVLDIVVFLNKFGKVIDFKYIENELDSIQLKYFSNVIFYICKKYFDTDIECTPIDDKKLEQIIDYILEHGVFGFDNIAVQSVMLRNNGDKGIKLFLKMMFPDMAVMTRIYPWFKNGNKYMLPYAWLRRWLYLLTNKNKRNEIGTKLSAIMDDDIDVNKHTEMIKSFGLKQDRHT